MPNDEAGIRSMLIEVRTNIAKLEKNFLQEEDSDAEEDDKLFQDLNFDVNIQQDDEETKKISYIDKR